MANCISLLKSAVHRLRAYHRLLQPLPCVQPALTKNWHDRQPPKLPPWLQVGPMVTILPPQSVLRSNHKTAQSMLLRSRTQPLKMRVRAAPFPPTPAPNSARNSAQPAPSHRLPTCQSLRHHLYTFQRCVCLPTTIMMHTGSMGAPLESLHSSEPPRPPSARPLLSSKPTCRLCVVHQQSCHHQACRRCQTLHDCQHRRQGRPQDRYHHLHDHRQASHRDSRKAGSVLRHVQAPTTTMKSHGRCRGSLQSNGLRNVPILVARSILAAQGGTLDASIA